MKKTIAQTIIDEMEKECYEYVGAASGTYSFRKGSNLSKALEFFGLTKDDVVVKTGARAGKHKTEGYELLIFKKK